MAIHYDMIEDGKNKTSQCLFSFLVRMCYLSIIINSVIYLEKILPHPSIHVICIITPLEKEMIQSSIFFFF